MGNDGNPLNNVENSFLGLLLSMTEIDSLPNVRNLTLRILLSFFFLQTFLFTNYNKFKIMQFLLNNLI